VRQLLNNLKSHFEDNAEKEAIISVDEQMIPYKGKLGLKVYMKNKPTKWGIKVGKLSFFFFPTGFENCYFSPHILEFNFFQGVGNGRPVRLHPQLQHLWRQLEGDRGRRGHWSKVGKSVACSYNENIYPHYTVPNKQCCNFLFFFSGQTVLNLVKDLEPGTHVFFDNYFASPGILLTLKELGLPSACTLRSNRTERCPFKTEKELKKAGRGAMDHHLSDDGILLVKWFDNKVWLYYFFILSKENCNTYFF
jgi:hypothetical protein